MWTGLAAALLMVAPLPAQKPEAAESLLQTAMKREVVDGNLTGAIEGYKKALAAAKGNRAVAANVLVRMAECYLKMGDAESRKIFEQVVREYGDQKEAVAAALARLGGTSHSGRQTNTLVWTPPNGFGASISPDGRYISHVAVDASDLTMYEVASHAIRNLTNQGTSKESNDFADSSAISKDGKQVAYTWFRRNNQRRELRIGNLAGDLNPRILFDNPEVIWMAVQDWSPDGKSIAIRITHRGGIRQIGLVSVPEGALRTLKTFDWQNPSRVWFSPDGKYLGYDLPESQTGAERDVFVLSVDGTREVHAVSHRSNDEMMGWAPDGKGLLFASDRMGSRGLWRLPFSDGKPQGAPELLRAEFAARAIPVGITQAGALYYATSGTQDRFKIQVAEIDFATGKLLSGPKDLSQDYLESNALPEWSPDGRQLSYKSVRGPAQRPTHEVVVIRSIDTGQVRELYPKLAYFGPMMWSPDGRSFLTLGGDLRGRAGIFQVDGQTGDASTHFLDRPGERSWYPQWAGDGWSFYFRRDYSATKESAIIHRDLLTGREKELVRRRVLLCQAPNMSLDRLYLACRSVDETSNLRTLLLIPVDGGGVRELMRYSSEVPAEDLADGNKGVWIGGCSIWAADSRSCLATKGRETWRIPIEGGVPEKLAGTLDLGILVNRPSMHPDGRRIAISVREPAPKRDPEIWALENFLPSRSAAK
jgi:Tol biopolymer transport system component